MQELYDHIAMTNDDTGIDLVSRSAPAPLPSTPPPNLTDPPSPHGLRPLDPDPDRDPDPDLLILSRSLAQFLNPYLNLTGCIHTWKSIIDRNHGGVDQFFLDRGWMIFEGLSKIFVAFLDCIGF